MRKSTKTALIVVAVLLLAVFGFKVSTEAASCPWSTTYASFAGQCTWYADGQAKQNGWTLKYSPKAGSGYQWWTEVTNAKQQSDGNPGDIMVFDKGNFSSVGHVAYVTSSGYYRGQRAWTVRHANWTDSNGQTVVDKICGNNIKQCTFVKVSGGVKIILNEAKNTLSNSTYPLKGFLHKK